MKFNKNEFGWKEKVNTNELPDDLSIGNSLTVGIRIRDIGQYSVAEGYQNTASGCYSHAEGEETTARGDCSHAEGESTIASGECSHAEGCYTIASNNNSHSEGEETTASGNSSHAEGDMTTASGDSSHAEGKGTIASSDYQHVQGKYNIEDTENKYAHIVGNGKYDYSTLTAVRSNAHTLDWKGNAWYQGKLSQDGTPTEDKDLTTKKYVDDTIASQPQISFDTEGNLVVTIGGVTKKFKEIIE